MINLCAVIASYLFNACWQIGIICLAAYLTSRLLKAFGIGLQHKIWVCALAVSAIVPVLGVWRLSFQRNAAVLVAQTSPFIPGETRMEADILPHGIAIIPLVAGLCAALYSLIAALQIVKLCYQLLSIRRILKSAIPVGLAQEKQAAWTDVLEAMHTGPVSLLGSPLVSGPITLSRAKPVIVLPPGFAADATLDVFRAAIAHECAHIRRRDYRKNLLYEVLYSAIAFHPLARFMKAQIARTREMLCDAAVVRSVMNWRSYASALLDIARTLTTPATRAHSQALAVLGSSDFEQRIMMLKQLRHTNIPQPGRTVTFAAAGLVTVASLLAAAWTRPIAAQTAATNAAAPTHPLKYNPALICTYYDPSRVGHDGTCGRDPDTRAFKCLLNEDPRMSQSQIACESKVLKAERKAHSSAK